MVTQIFAITENISDPIERGELTQFSEGHDAESFPE
jgi:hypothetical protein